MKLKDYPLEEGNHFIAMEYYNLIFNRTFLVLIVENYLIGLQVRGIVSVDVRDKQSIEHLILEKMVVTGDLENPYSYISDKYLLEINALNILGEEILNVKKANFKIHLSEIESVTYNSKRKWGMGYYPHDGKVYVKTKNKKKEFIILGNQSGKEIENWIKKSVKKLP